MNLFIFSVQQIKSSNLNITENKSKQYCNDACKLMNYEGRKLQILALDPANLN